MTKPAIIRLREQAVRDAKQVLKAGRGTDASTQLARSLTVRGSRRMLRSV
jgi:hypothetical protein